MNTLINNAGCVCASTTAGPLFWPGRQTDSTVPLPPTSPWTSVSGLVVQQGHYAVSQACGRVPGSLPPTPWPVFSLRILRLVPAPKYSLLHISCARHRNYHQWLATWGVPKPTAAKVRGTAAATVYQVPGAWTLVSTSSYVMLHC